VKTFVAAVVPREKSRIQPALVFVAGDHLRRRPRDGYMMSMTMKLFTTVALGVLLALAGCGEGGATTACTLGTGATRVCLEIWTNTPASGGLQKAEADCTNDGGVASTTCSHVGADGGCGMSIVSGAIMEKTTQWFYAGMASSEMASCLQGSGNTWVSP
jgi:hypothetical protein